MKVDVLQLYVGNKNQTQVQELPASIQLLDLCSILDAYMKVQNTHLRHHATPMVYMLISICANWLALWNLCKLIITCEQKPEACTRQFGCSKICPIRYFVSGSCM